MIRWTLLILALSLLALGALTVVKSPDWSPWRLAVLAGEYGHWLAPVALAVVLVAICVRQGSSLWLVTSVVGLSATTLLLRPAYQARRISQELPDKLRRELGEVPGGPTREPFAWRTVLGGAPEQASVSTYTFKDELALDFYQAKRTGGKPTPCVIIVHGGGWDSGDRKQLDHFNHWLAHAGYHVAAVSYRLAPTYVWPAQGDDVLAALAFLKQRAGELAIDPKRFVLLGRSAGGQIAQAVGFSARDPAICGVVSLYAPSDLIFGYVNTHENDMLKSPALMRQFLGGTPETARGNYESASAVYHVTRTSPPTLLLHGTNDALVWYRHSVRLDAVLTNHGVRHAFVELPWASHAFDYNLHGPGGQLTTYSIEWFLAAVTRE